MTRSPPAPWRARCRGSDILSAGVITGICFSHSGVTIMGRVLGNNGEPIVQADVNTIIYSVRDLTDGQTDSTLNSLTVSAVVFNDLQQSDPHWTADSRYKPGRDYRHGYNFATTLPATAFTDFDVGVEEAEVAFAVTRHTFQVTVEFTPASGAAFRQAWQFSPIPTW